jgi:transposase
MIPADHILRRIDGLIDLGELRDALAPHYSRRGRPSIAPELLVRMALIARLYGITSERRLCEEVRFNLAYRWFCRLPLDAPVPHHSTFSKNRHGRFRDAGIFRILFEQTVRRCADAGLIAHKDAAIDASFVAADASWQRKMRDADMAAPRLPRPVCEWLADQANAPPQEWRSAWKAGRGVTHRPACTFAVCAVPRKSFCWVRPLPISCCWPAPMQTGPDPSPAPVPERIDHMARISRGRFEQSYYATIF